MSAARAGLVAKHLAKGWGRAPDGQIPMATLIFAASSGYSAVLPGKFCCSVSLVNLQIEQADHGGHSRKKAMMACADRHQGGYIFGVAFELFGSRCSACRHHIPCFSRGDRASDCDSLARPPTGSAARFDIASKPKPASVGRS